MTILKRLFLFGAVNFAIMIMLMFVLNLLGVNHYLTAQGIDYTSLMIFSLVWGMGGSFISLLLSKTIAKMSMRVQIIDPNTSDSRLASLVNSVHNLARGAGLSKMPEVGIYESPEVNAFATGPSKRNSLVAVSTGLLNRLDKGEVDGVLGHEVAHIANGDMVTMTLVQGVINAFVIFFAKIVAWTIANFLRGDEEEGPSFFAAFAIEMVLHVVFGLIGMIIVSWFSRFREFRADKGGAQLAGRGNMIAALEKLKSTVDLVDDRQEAVAAFKISGKSKFMALFSTHPPLDQRIARLRQMA